MGFQQESFVILCVKELAFLEPSADKVNTSSIFLVPFIFPGYSFIRHFPQHWAHA
jgi:hypothetical protein